MNKRLLILLLIGLLISGVFEQSQTTNKCYVIDFNVISVSVTADLSDRKCILWSLLSQDHPNVVEIRGKETYSSDFLARVTIKLDNGNEYFGIQELAIRALNVGSCDKVNVAYKSDYIDNLPFINKIASDYSILITSLKELNTTRDIGYSRKYQYKLLLG